MSTPCQLTAELHLKRMADVIVDDNSHIIKVRLVYGS